jgi:hypothetical protein
MTRPGSFAMILYTLTCRSGCHLISRLTYGTGHYEIPRRLHVPDEFMLPLSFA